MRTIVFTKTFKKSMKDVRSYPAYKEKELDDALKTLANGGSLPTRMEDHPMVKHSAGYLNGARVFHLRPNLVVVYRMTDEVIEVLNIGLHNKTKLTSSYRSDFLVKRSKH